MNKLFSSIILLLLFVLASFQGAKDFVVENIFSNTQFSTDGWCTCEIWCKCDKDSCSCSVKKSVNIDKTEEKGKFIESIFPLFVTKSTYKLQNYINLKTFSRVAYKKIKNYGYKDLIKIVRSNI